MAEMSFSRSDKYICGRKMPSKQMLLYSTYLLLIYIYEVSYGYSIRSFESPQRHKRAADCKIYGLKIKNCGVQVSRFGNERIKAKYQHTCNLKDKAFDFEFGKDGEYSFTIGTTEPVVTVKAMKKKLKQAGKVFSPGTHYVSVAMNAKSLKNEQMSTSSAKCTFYVRHENATASLGPLNIVVNSGVNIVVDARSSINNDLEEKYKGLEFRWKCNDTEYFCMDYPDLGTASRVKVDSEYINNKAKFKFTVEVRSLPTSWQSATQYITVDDSRIVSINCVELCGKKPNSLSPNEHPLLSQQCESALCEQRDPTEIHGIMFDENGQKIAVWNDWTEDYSFDKPLPAGTKVMCKAFYGDLADEDYLGEQEFDVLPFPELKNCKAIPPKGNPLTKFKVACDYKEGENKNFEIRVLSGETTVFSESAAQLEDLEFLVSDPDGIITVKMTNFDDIYMEREVKVEIEPLMETNLNTSSALEKLDDIYEGKVKGTDSVSDLMKNGEQAKAVQVIDVVAKGLAKVEVTTEEEKTLVENRKKHMMDDLMKMQIDNISMSKSVSGVMKEIATDRLDDASNSDMAKLLTESCGTVAKNQLYLVQNDVNDDINRKEVVDVARNLMTCAETETSPNYDVFKETGVDVEVTTPFPLNMKLAEKSFEDYPQYVSDDLIEEKVKDFLAAAQNMVDICRDMGDSLSYSFPTDMSKPIYIARKTSTVSIMKSKGHKFTLVKFQLHDVTIIPPLYLRKFDTPLSMRVCSYQNDPYWSTSKDYKIPTSVVDIRIVDEESGDPLTRFGTSLDISFKVNGELVKKIFSNGIVQIPDESSVYKEDEFTIFIIKARGRESFFIDFHELTESDNYEIVIIPMKRPQLKDFSEPILINHTNSKHFVTHNDAEDQWFMLGVKPGKNMPSDKPIDLDFVVYTPKCVSWNDLTKTWEFACSVYLNTTPEMINCECMHLSTIAGAFEYNELKPHPKFIHLDFELEESESLFIVLSVVILIGVYFFLLVYSVQKNETLEDAVYLMSDVPAENRFAYLVVVYTGGWIDSGTSSEIIVKLLGKEACSQEHVVNFPDPLLELLQRTQTDYFVLASPLYLGRLKRIHVWYDCTGNSPNWYCNKIRVCDMQTKAWYAFKINKWFKVDGKPRLFVSVGASVDKEDVQSQKKKTRLIKSFLSFGRFDKTIWHLSTSTTNINFAYPKRLTLILSVIITLMTITMLFYGKPEFLPRDTIRQYCYFKMRPSILYIGMYSAMLTFLPHLVVMEGFKNSRIQFQSKHSKDAKILPAVFTVIFWVVLTINIIIQIHVLLVDGYKIIAPTTWEWMLSVLFGFFFYVFILDYLYNILVILVGGAVQPVRLNFEKILRNIEKQRKFLYETIGHYIYRPILGPIYDLMNRAEYVRKRIHFRQKRDMMWQVQDFIMIVTFMLLLYIIVLGEKDSIYDFRGHEEAIRLTLGAPSGTRPLSSVNHMREFESFMEKGFIPSMQAYQWYGKYVTKNAGMTSDFCNKYLGVFRLRQHRVEEGSCEVSKRMQFVNRTCRSPGYFFRYDYLNYTPSWNNTIEEMHGSRMGSVWGHQSGIGKIVLGLAGFYDSGGYVANLGRTIENSFVNFNYLKRYNWLDPLTRAVVMEFCLYNVNKNLFHFAEVVLEKTPAGYITKDVTVKTERVVKHSSNSKKIALICSLVFMILVLAMCIRTVLRIIKTKVWYKRDLWHIVDVLIVILSIAWIGLYFKRFDVLQAFVSHLEGNPSNSFVDYFPILNTESSMRSLAATLICISTIRMWKVVRFGVIFRTVERTLLLSLNSLCTMLMLYIICIIAFGVTFFVTLGSRVGKFRNNYQVLRTLLSITIGIEKAQPNDVCLNDRGLGYAFSILFSLFSQYYTTIFIAVIVFGFDKARLFAFEEKLDYNLKDYAKDRLDGLKLNARVLAHKFRLTAGGKRYFEEEMVEPKDDILRYKNCVQTDSNRMKAMASVAKCVLLKKQKGEMMEESDHTLMMRTVRNLCNTEQGEKEIFFTESSKDTGISMVDDRRILMMEKIVKRMLESKEMKARREAVENLEEALRADNLARMMQMNYQLKVISRAVHNIEINIPKNHL